MIYLCKIYTLIFDIYIYIAPILYVIDAKDRNLYTDINYILILRPQNNSR